MTALTKNLVAISLSLAVGAAYQIHLLARQRAQSHALAQKTVNLDMQIGLLREQRDRTLTDLSTAKRMMEKPQLPSDHTAPDSELGAWLDRVRSLEQWLQRAPEKNIPEMKYLKSNDWLSVTMSPLDTDAKIRTALSKLRGLAKAKPQVGTNLANALQSYIKSNNGLLPSDPTQLRPYLNPQLSDELLRRYEPAPEIPDENDANGLIRDGMRFLGSGRVVLQEKAPVDEDYDTWVGFLESGGSASLGVSKLGKKVSQAIEAFSRANNGQAASTPEQLLPYLAPPIELTRLKEYWDISRH